MNDSVEAAGRASGRAAAHTHEGLRRGLGSLATIASTAPWIGLLGTIHIILSAFRGFTGSRSAILGVYTGVLSRSLVPTCIGLATAIVAFVCYQYFSAMLQNFDREMDTATLEMMNGLLAFDHRRVR
jgi:biopolymer transport protein ExbB/TolQ